MANRLLPYSCNVVYKIVEWRNGHGVQFEYLKACISKLVNTDKAMTFIQA